MNFLIIAVVCLAVASTHGDVLYSSGLVSPLKEHTLVQGPIARTTITGPDGGSIVAENVGTSFVETPVPALRISPDTVAVDTVALDTKPIVPVAENAIYTHAGRFGAIPLPYYSTARYVLPANLIHPTATVVDPVSLEPGLTGVEVARNTIPVLSPVAKVPINKELGLPLARYVLPGSMYDARFLPGYEYWPRFY